MSIMVRRGRGGTVVEARATLAGGSIALAGGAHTSGRGGTPVPAASAPGVAGAAGMAPVSGIARAAGGASAPAPLAERVRVALEAGGTVRSVAIQCGTSEIFVKTMLDHYERLGYLTEAQSLCSSGLGACSSPADALSMEARVHCAGCPLTV